MLIESVLEDTVLVDVLTDSFLVDPVKLVEEAELKDPVKLLVEEPPVVGPVLGDTVLTDDGGVVAEELELVNPVKLLVERLPVMDPVLKDVVEVVVKEPDLVEPKVEEIDTPEADDCIDPLEVVSELKEVLEALVPDV